MEIFVFGILKEKRPERVLVIFMEYRSISVFDSYKYILNISQKISTEFLLRILKACNVICNFS